MDNFRQIITIQERSAGGSQRVYADLSYASFLIEMSMYREEIAEIQDQKNMEYALAESLNSYKCLERKPDIIVDVKKTLHDDDDDSNCAICLEALTGDVGILPVCKHTFHHQCIVEWGKYKAECPLCKLRIPKNKLKI